jgi:hypothetical protein
MSGRKVRRILLYISTPQNARAVYGGYYSRVPGFPGHIRCRSVAPAVELAHLF